MSLHKRKHNKLLIISKLINIYSPHESFSMFTTYTWFNYGSVKTRNEFNVFLSLDSLLYPQELEKQGVTVSLTSSVIEDLFKDDYVYEVSNEDPTKEQQQQAQEPLVQQQSEQEAPVNPCEEPTAQQSEQEAPVDVCLSEPIKQGVTGSLTSSVIEEFFKDADVYEVSDEEKSQEPLVAWQSKKETLILSSFDSAAQPRQRENERPSFSLGISPPASQPTQPSQERVSQLEILAKAVVDAGVAAALKFAEATSSKSNLPAAKVFKTPEKR
ncbi:hypothetical protein Ahy_B05g077974 isoform A [Arachis hypogaea]|uniref:Uncharacterized protein n=1 Tax=Arachis hypogaea TaxID=3818 RepID=A0A444Z609_ARAHY|nr:hypothetical protein Ahy_B05g077974 isoform A [Arachis hypogaea]